MTTAPKPIEENFGKDLPKIRRGRPRKMSAKMEQYMRREILDNKPVKLRTAQNWERGMHAMTTLVESCGGLEDKHFQIAYKRWPWLLRGGHYRPSIMNALGRVTGEHAIIEIADQIEKRKFTAQDAIRYIRLWRKAYGI